MKKYIYILIMLAAPWYLSAQTLTIGDDAVVTIGVGASVSYGTAASSGTVTSDANTKLVIESTSSGSGSLICGGTPNAAVNSYITADKWHLVSPTTSGTTVNNYHFNFSPRSWLTYFDEDASTSGDWVYMTELSDAVNVYQGYSLYIETSAQTIEYTGNLVSSDKLLNGASTPALAFTDASHGYNLIGNPFPCAIDFDGTWTVSNVDQNVWVWSDGIDNYVAYSPSGGLGTLTDGIIPMGQGFFIHANAASPEFTIPASARVHSTQAFYKSPNARSSNIIPHLKLELSKDQKADVVYVGFDENCTLDFDQGYDARKMYGPEDSPQAFLKGAGLDLSINSLPIIENDPVSVDLSFIAGIEGEQSINASIYELQDISIELEEKKSSIIHDLVSDPTYTFSSSKFDDPDRFIIHFNRTTTGLIDEVEKNDIRIYSYGNNVYVEPENTDEELRVIVTDIYGRLLTDRSYQNQSKITIPVFNGMRYYIVTAVQLSEIKTSKVLIK